jgi:hypothetical protein
MMPKNRKELERKMHSFTEKTQKGPVRLNLPTHSRTAKSIENIRNAPNGRIDLATIDEMTRAMLNAIGAMQF